MTLPAAKNAVAAFVKLREGRTGLDPDVIHAIGSSDGLAELRLSDLRVLLESLNDAGAVAWVTESALAALIKTRNDDYPGTVEAWQKPTERATVPLYTHPASAEVDDALTMRACNAYDDSLRKRGELTDENESEYPAMYAALTAALAQPASSRVPTGWKLVPVEPTEAMIQAMHDVCLADIPPDGHSEHYGPTTSANAIYKAQYAAMLAAAQPTKEPTK